LISFLTFTVGIPEIYPEDFYIFSGIFGFLAFLSISSHVAAMVIDPGREVPESALLLSSGLPCSICNVNKRFRTHHCMVCNRCILNMDHHCPWINNCVGFKNQKHFVLFLVYTSVCISWFLVLMVQAAFLCRNSICMEEVDPLKVYFIVVCSVFALFFLILLILSLKEQIRVIVTNTSEIDYLQCRIFIRVKLI
jgi:palmitoyltransferase